tara:strand:- start:216 stop:485 length:270 start_codon:yes stop_codon:yes gene_type:complete
MWSRVELINRVMEDVLEDHRKSIFEDGELTLTTVEARQLVEKTVEETKKHIAKKLVESKQETIRALARGGFFDDTEDAEELVLAALEKL